MGFIRKTINNISLITFVIILLSSGIISSIKERGDKSSKDDRMAVASESSRQETVEDGSAKVETVLIVYFSLTGNTKQIAGIMKDFTKGEVFEIQPDFDYSKIQSKSEMENIGEQQVKEGFKPKLKNSVIELDAYDLIIIGSPVWWYSVTPPVMSFLSQYNLSGKKVAPFCTCGSVAGDFFTQFKDAIPDAKVLEGLTLTESELRDKEKVKEKIRIWLKDSGCKNLSSTTF